MIDMNHTLWQSCEWANLRMENDSTITGYKLVKGWGPERHVYFAAVFSRKLTGLRFTQDSLLRNLIAVEQSLLPQPEMRQLSLFDDAV